MIWQETTAARALAHQQSLLADAEARRFTLRATDTTPLYREWLARQLVVLALRLAPSLRATLSVSDRSAMSTSTGRRTSLMRSI